MFHLKIATPERVVYENDVLQISIPTASGEITVLPHHTPLVSVLSAGELRIKDQSGDQTLAVVGGFLEVRPNNELIILADHAQRAEEIDVTVAEAARARAEEQMKQLKSGENVDYARLQALIDRETNKIKVGKKYKNLHQ